MKRALISAALTAAAVTLSSAPAWASTASSPPVQPGRAAYTVAPGASFWSIGQWFHLDMQDVAAWNHMDLNAPLDAGWTLQIPPAGWHSTGSESYTASTGSGSGSSNYGASSYAPGGVWACIAQHESGANPATDTGNGYYGMYQFTMGTWQAAGGTGNPTDASAAEQTAVAQRVQEQQGWGAWPVTSQECGA